MSKLVEGKIPANTVCPFLSECSMTSQCHHQGKNHSVPFSCAAARGFDIILGSQKNYKAEKIDKIEKIFS